MRDVNEQSFIRRRRKELGVTVPEIARACGVSDPAAWKWDSGQSLPKAEHIPQIAATLKVDGRTLEENLERIQVAKNAHEVLDEAAEQIAKMLGLERSDIRLSFTIEK